MRNKEEKEREKKKEKKEREKKFSHCEESVQYSPVFFSPFLSFLLSFSNSNIAPTLSATFWPSTNVSEGASIVAMFSTSMCATLF
jgi:hypothetical protein